VLYVQIITSSIIYHLLIYRLAAESERYRNTLRRRDQEIKDYQEAAALQSIENHKYIKEHDNYEERIAFLEGELAIAQQAFAQLEEQKQENLMLKETIDRMRYDMDEMRNNAASAAMGGSGQSSAANSMSKSLGAELLGQMTGAQWEKMKGAQWGIEGENGEDGDEGENESESVQVIDMDSDGEETESEDVVQTIITRKKRVGYFIQFFGLSGLMFGVYYPLEGSWSCQQNRDGLISRNKGILGRVHSARGRWIYSVYSNANRSRAHSSQSFIQYPNR
jgi:hypothetical protein